MKDLSKELDLRKESSQVGFEVKSSVPAKSKIKGSFATSFCQNVLGQPKGSVAVNGVVPSDSQLPSEEEKCDDVRSKESDSVSKEEVR